MKKINPILFLLFGYIQFSFSQELYISGLDSEGIEIKQSDTMLLGETYTFEIKAKGNTLPVIQSMSWELLIQTRDMSFTPFLKESTGSSYQVTIHKDAVLKRNTDFLNSLKRFAFDNNHAVYFQGLLICEILLPDETPVQLSLPVFLNLLPSRPSVNIIESHLEETYPSIVVKYHTERANKVYQALALYDEDGYNYTTILLSRSNRLNKDTIHFGHREDINYGFDEKAFYLAINDFGEVTSDTISIFQLLNSSLENSDIRSKAPIVFPNPAKDFIHIKNLSTHEIESIFIANSLGQLSGK